MTPTDASYQLLKTVIDPELGVNIVDLGLIYKVTQHESGQISVLMTLTSPGCPLASTIVEMIKNALSPLVSDPEADVSVEITFDPPWTTAAMSEELQAQFGVDEW